MQQPNASSTQGQVLVRVCTLVQGEIDCCILLLLVPKMVCVGACLHECVYCVSVRLLTKKKGK